MENRIIKSLIDNFLSDFGIKEKTETAAFEHFCNYCFFAHAAPDLYDTDRFVYQTVHTGDGGDNAIDGILILVNDIAITNKDQVESIVRERKFDVKFIFVQSKTSSNFDSGEMLKVAHGVRDLFMPNQLVAANDRIKLFKETIDCIFNYSINFKDNPICNIYYATTGKWIGDSKLEETQSNCTQILEETNLFSEVRFIPVDASRLISLYKEVTNSIRRQVILAKNVAFPPDILGVEQAYLGLIRFDEYLKLITDEDGFLQIGLFYDNVRGYLGENPVNEEIIKTLENEQKAIQFPILNNGITIVAKELKSSGDKFTLTDFQIVNGCQTTNVLYKCRNIISKEIMVPIKLINTNNPDLINDVIRSTNRQTQVLDEAFESLKKFHKDLQDFYNTFREKDRIYYERRIHEYDLEGKDIKKTNIITLPIQLMSVLSMFYDEPHSVHRYYGELLNSNAAKIFKEGHSLLMYYTSAWSLHKVDNAIRMGAVEPQYKPYRYHFLCFIQCYIRKLIKMSKRPQPNSHEMDRLCQAILKAVSDDRTLGAMMRLMLPIISKAPTALGINGNDGNPISRRKDFTQFLIKEVVGLP